VNLLNLPASTRSLRRVGRWALFFTVRSRATGAVTFRMSFDLEALRGLTNAERPLDARKMTVLPLALGRKWRPLIVSVPPTVIRIGVTCVTTGAGAFLAADAPGAPTRVASAATASMQMLKTLRDITYPLSTDLVAV
jgi:hypothetical protein